MFSPEGVGVAMDSPAFAGIVNDRIEYNALRQKLGLPMVFDFGKAPAVPVKWEKPASKKSSEWAKPEPMPESSHHPQDWFNEWDMGGSFLAPQFGMYHKPNWKAPPPKPKGPPHPKLDDHGKPVHIAYPTKPSDPKTWTDPDAVATWAPGSETPKKLNGIAFKKFSPPASWAGISGTAHDLDRLIPVEPVKGKTIGAGTIIEEPDGRVWLVRPTNGFAGYNNTYPKGTLENGLSLQETAIKETWEETGLKVRITGVLGDFERSGSVARYYLARREGGTPSDMGWEAQAVRLVPKKKLMALLNSPVDKDIVDEYRMAFDLDFADEPTKTKKSRGRDLVAADPTLDIEDLVRRIQKDASAQEGQKKGGHWETQPRWPSGSAIGGQWKAFDPDGITLPPDLSTGKAKVMWPQSAANALYEEFKKGNVTAIAQAATDHAKQAISLKLKKAHAHSSWHAKVAQYANELAGLTPKIASPQVSAAMSSPTEKPVTEKGPLLNPKSSLAVHASLLSDFKEIGKKPGGASPGALYEHVASGEKYLVKSYPNKDAAQNEAFAALVYGLLGVATPGVSVVDLQGAYYGGLGVASLWVKEKLRKVNWDNPDDMAKAQATFAAHALLANWDCVGGNGKYDNLLIGEETGKVYVIDSGGALAMKGLGYPKPAGTFAQTVGEIESMRNAALNPETAKIFGGMSQSQIVESMQSAIAAVDAVGVESIKTLADGLGVPASTVKTLMARIDDMRAKVKAGTTESFSATNAADAAMLNAEVKPAGYGDMGVSAAASGWAKLSALPLAGGDSLKMLGDKYFDLIKAGFAASKATHATRNFFLNTLTVANYMQNISSKNDTAEQMKVFALKAMEKAVTDEVYGLVWSKDAEKKAQFLAGLTVVASGLVSGIDKTAFSLDSEEASGAAQNLLYAAQQASVGGSGIAQALEELVASGSVVYAEAAKLFAAEHGKAVHPTGLESAPGPLTADELAAGKKLEADLDRPVPTIPVSKMPLLTGNVQLSRSTLKEALAKGDMHPAYANAVEALLDIVNHGEVSPELSEKAFAALRGTKHAPLSSNGFSYSGLMTNPSAARRVYTALMMAAAPEAAAKLTPAMLDAFSAGGAAWTKETGKPGYPATYRKMILSVLSSAASSSGSALGQSIVNGLADNAVHAMANVGNTDLADGMKILFDAVIPKLSGTEYKPTAEAKPAAPPPPPPQNIPVVDFTDQVAPPKPAPTVSGVPLFRGMESSGVAAVPFNTAAHTVAPGVMASYVSDMKASSLQEVRALAVTAEKSLTKGGKAAKTALNTALVVLSNTTKNQGYDWDGTGAMLATMNALAHKAGGDISPPTPLVLRAAQSQAAHSFVVGDSLGLETAVDTIKKAVKDGGGEYEETALAFAQSLQAKLKAINNVTSLAEKMTAAGEAAKLKIKSAWSPNVSAFYQKTIDSVVEAAKGDLALNKLNGFANSVKASSVNGKAVHALIHDLKSMLTEKSAVTEKVAAEQAKEAVRIAPMPPKAGAQVLPGAPAVPDHTKYLTPESGKKWASVHNPKILKIKELAEKGDAEGILSMTFNGTWMGKWQAKYAKDCLAAMGAPTASMPTPKASVEAANKGEPPHPATSYSQAAKEARKQLASLKEKAKAAYDKAIKAFVPVVPAKIDIANWNGPGKPLSSVAAVNESNIEMVERIHALATAASKDKSLFAELTALKFPVVNKAGNVKTGEFAPMVDHPSQHVKKFWHDTIDAFDAEKTVKAHVAQEVYDLEAKASVGHLYGALADSFPTVKNINDAPARSGRYAILGLAKVGNEAPWSFHPENTPQWQEMYDHGKKAFSTLSAVERQGITEYTGAGYKSINNPDTGVGTHSKTGSAIAGLQKAATLIPAGAVLSRKVNVDSAMARQMTEAIKKAGGEGVVLQDMGIISTSTSSETWSGQLRLRITVGQGVKGLYVAPNPSSYGGAISNHPGENEILLPYGTRFIVKKIHPSGAQVTDKFGSWGGATELWELVALPNV